MALAPSLKPFLTGGLRDTSGDSGLQKFIPEIWGMAVKDYYEKNLVFGKLATDLSSMVAGGGDINGTISKSKTHKNGKIATLPNSGKANGVKYSMDTKFSKFPLYLFCKCPLMTSQPDDVIAPTPIISGKSIFSKCNHIGMDR